MSMLSSVAERLYWMARYLERAEGMACLTNAYAQFILDVPKGTEPGWQSLINIINGDEAFGSRYKEYSERNVLKFMIADSDNHSSIRSSIKAVRENVRTTRDVLPEQCWELVNELYLYANEHADSSISRRNRFEFLDTVVARAQQINGLIESSLLRNHAYSFIKMGRAIERSDMTTRVVDVATASALLRGKDAEADLTSLWSNLLMSLSAVGAYRRETGPLIDASEVVDFVFKKENFPRSIHYCLTTIEQEADKIKNQEAVVKLVNRMKKKLDGFEAESFSLNELHDHIDRLQEQLIEINIAASDAWFVH